MIPRVVIEMLAVFHI